MTATVQAAWEFAGAVTDDVCVNAFCRLRHREGHRVVTVRGVVVAHYVLEDRLGEALAMASLVDQGHATQVEVARAFGCCERTVRRHQRRLEEGGLSALGRPDGYPQGRSRLPRTRIELVNSLKSRGKSNREIARMLGVSDKAIRKLLRRLGWPPQEPSEQLVLVGEGADPNLSGGDGIVTHHGPVTSPETADGARPDPPEGADPNLSGSSLEADEGPPVPVTFDSDPGDRSVDRLFACMGLLNDAAPLFESRPTVANAGVLLAIPALVDSGAFEIADDLYGSIGPAFYGLRTTIVTLLLMALMRIKRAEGLKEHDPRALGHLLGLDRAPEVKTLRRKLARLAAHGHAAQLGRALAEQRVRARGHAMGFLYVDGHVRAYHGKRTIPKSHVARVRLAMPATTDYWVNDAKGDPLFVVTSEANRGLVEMLPSVLDEVRKLVGERRVTVVFDRGGWSPKLFAKLLARKFDILTYRKGRSPLLAKSHFSRHEATIEGRKVDYRLADKGIYVEYGPRRKRKRLHLRQVTRLQDGHQTQIVTSRNDLPAIEVAYRMFERWRQENFFKYLREEYALDALVDYSVDPANPDRSAPNPERKALNAQLRKAYAEVNQLAAEFGVEALTNKEGIRRTMRGFKIANAPLTKLIVERMQHILELENQRATVPTRVPVKQLVEGDVIKLGVERKHLTDLFKMVAYQAESDLLRLIAPHYRRVEQEGRTLVQSAIAIAGDIDVTEHELRVALEPLSSPHRTKALAALCRQLNDTRTRFPGSKLRLRFEVKPEPPETLAFPGPRPSQPAAEGHQPDTSRPG
jgi:transposase